MKKCIIQFTILSMFLVSILSTQALAEQTEEIPNTIYPDNPLWFVIDRIPEKVSLFWSDRITRNPTALVEKKLIFSNERIREMQQMVYENKISSYQKSFNAFEYDLKDIDEVTEKVPEGLRKNIQFGLNKSLSNLQKLREQLPEQSRNGLDQAIQIHKQTIQRTNERIELSFKEKYGNMIEQIDSGSRRNID